MVFLDRAPARIAADCVIEDDLGGARLATTHLLHHGHRRIAFIGDSTRAPTTRQRLQGYREALAEAGVGFDEEIVYLGETDSTSLDATLQGFTRLADPPSCSASGVTGSPSSASATFPWPRPWSRR